MISFLFLLTLVASSQGSNLGGRCEYDQDCETDHTFCYNRNQCACMRGYLSDDAGQRCMATVGARCKSQQDCSTTLTNSECVGDECVCRYGYVADSSNKQCLQKASTYLFPCLENIQCVAPFGDAGMCVMQQCVCQPQYHYSENVCKRNKGLGDTCTTSGDCYISEQQVNRVECMSGVCKCKTEFTQEGDQCKDSASDLSISILSLLLCWLVTKTIV